jgi:hypothetical protein
MLILGNLYNQYNSLWIIVLSSIELNGYKYFKKTNVVDDVVIYQYNIKIDDENTYIQIGHETINIPNIKPQLNNTSVYFVSCDGQNQKIYNYSNPMKIYNVTDDTDMWKKLYIDIKADTNIHKYVIHLGDQVYMDEAHDELAINKTTGDIATVRRTYYNVYNTNYDNKYKKKILRNAYNIMIGDDHDIIDNYGSSPNNLTHTMLENVKDMYKIFQEDLYGIENHNIKHLVFNDFQIIIPDLRKYRKLTTDNITKYPIMGEIQMKEFDNIIKNTQTIIKRTYYVSTTPLVSVNKTLDKVLELLSGKKIDSHLDHYIASPIYTLEQKYILGKLFEFNSDVIIVCGDLHMADYFTFIKNGKTIKQITTSPISSNPIGLTSPLHEKIIGSLLGNLIYDRTIDNISIEKKWFILDYNYLKTTNKNAMLCCYNENNSKNIVL